MIFPSILMIFAVAGGLAFLVMISLAIADRVELLKLSAKGKLKRADIIQ